MYETDRVVAVGPGVFYGHGRYLARYQCPLCGATEDAVLAQGDLLPSSVGTYAMHYECFRNVLFAAGVEEFNVDMLYQLKKEGRLTLLFESLVHNWLVDTGLIPYPEDDHQ